MSPRRQLRVLAAQAVYAWLNGAAEDAYTQLLAAEVERLRKAQPERAGDANDGLFLRKLYRTAVDEQPFFEAEMGKHIQHWSLERIAVTDHAILLCGAAELWAFPDMPVNVTINEYIEVAKSLSTDRSGGFVNGVLDALHLAWKTDGRLKKSPLAQAPKGQPS